MTFKEIDKEINDIQKQISSLHDKLAPLTQMRNEMLIDEFFQDDILNESEWELNTDNNDLTISSHYNKHKKIVKLLEMRYDSSYFANYDCFIYFVDGEIDIVFEDKEKGFDFISKKNLRVDLTKIKNDVIELTECTDMMKSLIKKIEGIK